MEVHTPGRRRLPSGQSTASAKRRPALSRRKKLIFSGVAVAGFGLLLELLLAVAGVQPLASRDDPFVGFTSWSPLFVAGDTVQGATRMVTAPGKLTWFNEQEFIDPKPRGGYRIFTLGGSTTYGRPYDDRTSFSAWLQQLLARADPDGRYEVINAGGISYASYRVVRLLEELVEYEPDLFIVYTGHNEFLERRTYEHLIEMPEPVRGAGALLARTRTYTLLRSAFHPGSEGTRRATLPGEVRAQLDTVVGLEAYRRDDDLRRQVLAHFRFNLARMVAVARAAGAEVVFVTPASNLSGCAPFKSEHRAGLSDAERRAWQAAFDETGRASEAGDHAGSLAAVERALAIDARYAQAHYLRGRALLALDRFDEARRALVRAREEDVCPLRALTQIETMVREVARENDVPLVDFATIVRRRSPHGIPGEELFLDHVHPTIEGHGLLAAAVLGKMNEIGAVELPPGWSEEDVRAVAQRINGRVGDAYRAAALRNLSKVLGWAGKREEAGRLALKAVELNPADAEAQYHAGNALYQSGNLAGALECYKTSKSLEPDSAPTWYGLALVHTELGRLNDAIAFYREALRREPAFADAHYNLAQLLSERGELKASEQHFRAALRADPHHFEAANALGAILAQQQRYGEAAEWFERALRDAPDFMPARENLDHLRRLEEDE